MCPRTVYTLSTCVHELSTHYLHTVFYTLFVHFTRVHYWVLFSGRPDYWQDGKPISEIESRGIGQIRVLNTEEIAGMRLAGRVSVVLLQG